MNPSFGHRAGLYAAAFLLLCWLTGFAAFTVKIARLPALPAGPALERDKADAIIVLTGGAGRINAGLDLLASGHGRHLFITGVNSMVDMPTISAMWKGENPDLVTCCVTLGHQAHNTRQNAAEARKWIGGVRDVRSAYIVTSAYHMPRAMVEFRQALPGIVLHPAAVPYGAGPDHDQRNFWHVAFAEYNKTLLTWVRVAFIPKRELSL